MALAASAVQPPASDLRLHCAILEGNVERARALIAAGAALGTRDENGWTPLHCGMMLQDEVGGQIIEMLLLRNGCSEGTGGACASGLEVRDAMGFTPLHTGALHGQVEGLRIALGCGAFVDTVEAELGRGPLHIAVEQGHTDVVELLVSSGAALEAKAYHGTALHYAVRSRRKVVLEALLSAGASCHAVDSEGCSPLSLATTDGQVQAVQAMLEASNGDLSTHLRSAAENGDVPSLRGLVHLGADVHVRDAAGDTAFDRAAFGGQVEAMRALLELGASSRSQVLSRAFCSAVENGKAGAMRELEQFREVEISRAFHSAVQGGKLEVMRKLVENWGHELRPLDFPRAWVLARGNEETTELVNKIYVQLFTRSRTAARSGALRSGALSRMVETLRWMLTGLGRWSDGLWACDDPMWRRGV
ncbi:hypothetical protein CYMTET_24003 [Cymbomonas tetramitiformis]|uniref:Uncharacterized protein n=1 Tax=Cymbomonas tetramitiformis TaxID=36881 RepID=A0AAE0L0C5_9CHLO|nr:hypothetical protein CYMTET_24003 [Cymbomonas tetramitiformis]|eukprot:gene7902-9386_t